MFFFGTFKERDLFHLPSICTKLALPFCVAVAHQCLRGYAHVPVVGLSASLCGSFSAKGLDVSGLELIEESQERACGRGNLMKEKQKAKGVEKLDTYLILGVECNNTNFVRPNDVFAGPDNGRTGLSLQLVRNKE